MLAKENPKEYTNVVYDPAYVKETLIKLGFKNIVSIDKYFRAPAAYRGGNALTFSIEKKTGRWLDFKTHQKGSLKELPQLFGANGANVLIADGELYVTAKPEIEQREKFWEPTILTKLLPVYDFYTKRGISEKTLQLFKGGVAKQGDLANRFVFPIFHKSGKIHGFSGRNLKPKTNDFWIKWKHNGPSSSFLYPYYTIDACRDNILKKDCVYITESIGDTLSLWERGYKNTLVCFGTTLSQTLINTLITLNPSKIYLSPNNETPIMGTWGQGNKAAFNWYFKLATFFPLNKIEIKWSLLDKDFGDCSSGDINVWECTTLDTKNLVISVLESKIKKGFELSSKEEAVYKTLC